MKKVFQILKNTVLEYISDRAIRHGAAISFYTVFSLPAILIIIVNLAGAFFGEAQVEAQLLEEIRSLIGDTGAEQVRDMMHNLHLNRNSFWATVVGIGTLLFGATGAFYTLQDSLNMIWGIHQEVIGGFFKYMFDRALSFAMIISFGFILLVSMVINALIVAVQNFIRDAAYLNWLNTVLQSGIQVSDYNLNLAYLVNLGVTLFIISVVFLMLFRFLPDAKVPFRDLIVGSVLTALLFWIGEILIGWYLGNSEVADIYGAAGSVVVILLWVFYSAQILLFGAEFIKVNARTHGREIVPSPSALIAPERKIRMLFLKWTRNRKRPKNKDQGPKSKDQIGKDQGPKSKDQIEK